MWLDACDDETLCSLAVDEHGASQYAA